MGMAVNWIELAQKMAQAARAGVAIERKRLQEILAERQRKHGVLGGSERIDAERVFEPGDEHGKAERVQTGIEQNQIVTHRRQRLAVLARDLLHQVHYG